MKKITFSLPDDEYDVFVGEATSAPFLGNPTDYARKIISGRHEMTIEVAPDVEKQKIYYEAVIAQLEKSNQALTDRLENSSKSNGLSGFEMRKGEQSRVIQEQIEQFKKDWNFEKLTEQHEHLKEQYRLLNEKHKELEKEFDELSEETGSDKRIQGYVAAGGQVLQGILEKSPALQQRVAEHGLGGLFMGGPTQGALGSLSQEQQNDLAVGQSFRQEFQGERYGQMLNLFRFFTAYPGVPNSIMAGQSFQAFLASQAQA